MRSDITMVFNQRSKLYYSPLSGPTRGLQEEQMKLVEFEICNFRTLRGKGHKIRTDGPNIIFLLGQNNVGKSSILDAYEYLVKPKKKATLEDFCGFEARVPIEIFATFQIEPGDDEAFEEKGLQKWVDKDGFIRFKRRWEAPGQEGKRYTFDPTTEQFIEGGFRGADSHFASHAPEPIRIPAMPSPDELGKWLASAVKKLALKQLSDSERKTYQELIDNLATLKEKAASNERITELSYEANKHFQKIFPKLKLEIQPRPEDEVDIEKLLEKDFIVTVRDPILEKSQPSVDTQGHGVIRQAIFTMVGLLEEQVGSRSTAPAGKKFILLFEEPELYLHPAKVRLLREALYDLGASSSFQVLCASHSPSLIDLTKPHISLVRMTKNESGDISLIQAGDNLFGKTTELREKVLMANRFNPFVCEVFFADEVVIVEGDTEAIAFRELFSKLAPEQDIHVLNAGSKNNIPFFQDVLIHFQIKHHIVHDADSIYLTNKDGNFILNKDGSRRLNSAWSIGEAIWDKINSEAGLTLSRRYVFIPNFEKANKYTPNQEEGKPFSAYKFASSLDGNGSREAEKFARQIVGLEQPDGHNFSSHFLTKQCSQV